MTKGHCCATVELRSQFWNCCVTTATDDNAGTQCCRKMTSDQISATMTLSLLEHGCATMSPDYINATMVHVMWREEHLYI
jgi:hypothetical protein